MTLITKPAKPTSIKAIFAIIYFKLLSAVIMVAVFYITLDLPLNEITAMDGFRSALISGYGLDMSSPEYAFGQLLGNMLISFVISLFTLLFLFYRNFWFALVFVVIDLFVHLSIGFPLFAIIVLMLLIAKSSRGYFFNKKKELQNN